MYWAGIRRASASASAELCGYFDIMLSRDEPWESVDQQQSEKARGHGVEVQQRGILVCYSPLGIEPASEITCDRKAAHDDDGRGKLSIWRAGHIDYGGIGPDDRTCVGVLHWLRRARAHTDWL